MKIYWPNQISNAELWENTGLELVIAIKLSTDITKSALEYKINGREQQRLAITQIGESRAQNRIWNNFLDK